MDHRVLNISLPHFKLIIPSVLPNFKESLRMQALLKIVQQYRRHMFSIRNKCEAILNSEDSLIKHHLMMKNKHNRRKINNYEMNHALEWKEWFIQEYYSKIKARLSVRDKDDVVNNVLDMLELSLADIKCYIKPE